MAKVGDIGWFWCYHLGKAWKVLDRIQNIDPKDTHPYHTYLDSYYEHFQLATDEELTDLGLVRKEKLDIAVEALNTSVKAFDYLNSSIKLLMDVGLGARVSKKPVLSFEDRMPTNIESNYVNVLEELKTDVKKINNNIKVTLKEIREL